MARVEAHEKRSGEDGSVDRLEREFRGIIEDHRKSKDNRRRTKESAGGSEVHNNKTGLRIGIARIANVSHVECRGLAVSRLRNSHLSCQT